jgi:hypothetical protein
MNTNQLIKFDSWDISKHRSGTVAVVITHQQKLVRSSGSFMHVDDVIADATNRMQEKLDAIKTIKGK